MQHKKIKQILSYKLATFSLGLGLSLGLSLSVIPVLAVDFQAKDAATMKVIENGALQGDVSAQIELAKRYLYGQGVARNQTLAATWYTKAAEAGNAEAQFVLGQLYAEGIGVAPNLPIAIKWYQQSVSQGNEKA